MSLPCCPCTQGFIAFVLVQVGVGTSSLQEDMAKDGYKRILNVDYSETVIDHMKERHRDKPNLVYKVLDCR